MSDPYAWRDVWAEVAWAEAVLAEQARRLRLEGEALDYLRRDRGHTLSPAQHAKADRYPCPAEGVSA